MIDQKLIEFVKDGFKKGYTEQELRELLIKNKWPPTDINEALSFVRNLKQNQTLSPNADPKLVAFIRQAITKNYSKDEVTNILLTKGWALEHIERAFKEIEAKPQEQPLVSKPEKKRIIKKMKEDKMHMERGGKLYLAGIFLCSLSPILFFKVNLLWYNGKGIL